MYAPAGTAWRQLQSSLQGSASGGAASAEELPGAAHLVRRLGCVLNEGGQLLLRRGEVTRTRTRTRTQTRTRTRTRIRTRTRT